LTVESDVPVSVGVSSSAALEVASARGLGAGELGPLHLAALCQEAENDLVGREVVGWPTGAEHDVSGAPYARARTAAFMGRRMLDGEGWISGLAADAV